jgi:formylglycine-generating enzyme required for sulfatase activity
MSQLDFDWVVIPAGEFLMGSDSGKDPHARDVELPQHRCYLPTYRISRTPVTVRQFERFVQETGYRTSAEEQGFGWTNDGSEWQKVLGACWARPYGPDSDVQQKAKHPVTCVSWHDASAFCRWAGARLPTEAEWEKAARGVDGRIYPWGDEAPGEGRCNYAMLVGDTTPVGAYPEGASPYGLLDMAGNVREWTQSLWGKYGPEAEYGYPYDPADGRENLAAPDDICRVMHEGAFTNTIRGIRCACRYGNPPTHYDNISGFRVVALEG